ncbi:MAG: hypothetical protein MR346_11095, partial [Clostridium sp.]|nr:hypothetical protein [Clostridium sp.]
SSGGTEATTDNKIDWAWLYYIATVELRMTEEQFWNCNNRKLTALWKEHIKFNNRKYGNKEDEEEYIDNIQL